MSGAVLVVVLVVAASLVLGRRGSRTKDGGAVPAPVVVSTPRPRRRGPGRFPSHHGGL